MAIGTNGITPLGDFDSMPPRLGNKKPKPDPLPPYILLLRVIRYLITGKPVTYEVRNKDVILSLVLLIVVGSIVFLAFYYFFAWVRQLI